VRSAKGNDLQQPARHRDVLDEVEQLVLVGEIIVEDECRRYREDSAHRGTDTRAVARNQSEPTEDLDKNGDREPDLREREADRLDVADRGGGSWRRGQPSSTGRK